MPATCATIRRKRKSDAVEQDRLRRRIHATAAAVGIAAGAAGCGDRFCPPDTLCASPTAPTTADPASDAAGRGYSRDFYAALVFNAYDGGRGRYGGVLGASRVRDNPHAVSVMLDLTETTGTCPYAEHRIVARSGGSISWRHWIEQDTGPTIEQVTGRRWTGRLHVAEEPGEAEAVTGLLDWIVVRLQRRPGCETIGDGGSDTESPGRRCYGAGTYVGVSRREQGQADSTIYLDRYCRSAFSNEREFRHVWLHDALGHAMGFWHVAGGADVMGSGPWNKTRFTERERRAMRDAYRAGRGEPRIGGHRTIAPHPRSMPPMRPVLIEH